MGYIQSGTQFGQRRWKAYDQPLTPISDGLGVFAEGFGKLRGIYDDFADQMGNIPVIGPGIEMLFDNPAMAEILGVFDLIEGGIEFLQPIFETIEPVTDPVLREMLQEMGLNVERQRTPEEEAEIVEAFQRGRPGRATLAEEAQLGDVTASVSAPPQMFVPLSPGMTAGQAGLATQ